jgi:hypothetical protein
LQHIIVFPWGIGVSTLSDLLEKVAIRQYAGLKVYDGNIEYFGSALPLAELPKRPTRRLSSFEKNVASVILGLDEDWRQATTVFTSRYGSIGSHTLELLKEVITQTPLSPTQFSLSVHNASIGIASQLTKNTQAYTAISAGEQSVEAGLLECAAQLMNGASRVVLVCGEELLKDEYAAFSTTNTEVFFSCCLELSDSANTLIANALRDARTDGAIKDAASVLDVLISSLGAKTE